MTAPLRLDVVVDLVDRGGAETQLLTLVRAMDRRIVIPRLICLRREGELAGAFRDAGCEVVLVSRSGRVDTRPVRLARLLRGSDVVLVANHHRAALTLARLAAALVGVPSVVAVHDMGLGGRRSLPRDVVGTLAMSRALVAVAPRQVDHLRRRDGVGRRPWSRTAVHVVPNGVPVPAPSSPSARRKLRRDLDVAEDDVVVAMVGRLAPEKDHDTALRALARLAPTHPRLRLVIVGGGVREEALRRSVRAAGLTEHVRLTGARDDVPALLHAVDLFCHSSRDEAAPLAVLEAMHAGLPVVTTDAGALRDVVGDGTEGMVVPVGGDAALADRIAGLVADPDLRRRLGEAAAARAAAEFTDHAMARRYEAVLAAVCGRARPDDAPTVSFLCPAYRTERYLGATVDTVLAQTRGDWELVVVDNGLSDEVVEIAGRRPDPRIRVVRQPNDGMAGGFEAAAQVARGRILVPLSSDDGITPGYCARMVAVLDAHPGVDAVSPDAFLFDDARGRFATRSWRSSVGERRRPSFRRPVRLVDVVAGRDLYYGAAIRRAAWDAAGGYRDGDASDLGLWLRLLDGGHDVRRLPERLGVYRVRAGSLSRDGRRAVAYEAAIADTLHAVVDPHQDPVLDRALDRRLRQRRYLAALARARVSFVEGDLGRAREEAAHAAAERRTARAQLVLLGLHGAPHLLARIHRLRRGAAGAVNALTVRLVRPGRFS